MTDLPAGVDIHEEGPRKGFQIEPGPVAAADKARSWEGLAETALYDVQCISSVDLRRLPGMADAVEVARTIRQRPDVRYTAIALNLINEQLNFDQPAVFVEAPIGTLALTEDAAEGRAAFIEKRPPVWLGRNALHE